METTINPDIKASWYVQVEPHKGTLQPKYFFIPHLFFEKDPTMTQILETARLELLTEILCSSVKCFYYRTVRSKSCLASVGGWGKFAYPPYFVRLALNFRRRDLIGWNLLQSHLCECIVSLQHIALEFLNADPSIVKANLDARFGTLSFQHLRPPMMM